MRSTCAVMAAATGQVPTRWRCSVTTCSRSSTRSSDPAASSRDGLAALIPGGQLITIPAGHLVHAAQPARFISAVTAFLAGAARP